MPNETMELYFLLTVTQDIVDPDPTKQNQRVRKIFLLFHKRWDNSSYK